MYVCMYIEGNGHFAFVFPTKRVHYNLYYIFLGFFSRIHFFADRPSPGLRDLSGTQLIFLWDGIITYASFAGYAASRNPKGQK